MANSLLSDITYLDHAGNTIYANSLTWHLAKDTRSNLYGNRLSASPSSELSTRRVEQVRARILKIFQADPEYFDVVFVQNATAAIKLVADAFSDSGPPGFWYGYHRDAHASLVGVSRLAAKSKCFESDQEVEEWLRADGDKVLQQENNVYPRGVGLFAYPAQSDMNGHRLPMDWPARVRASSHAKYQNLYILLDAAAYVMTAQLDLSDVESAPDFTALSFYKIFGFPHLGALIVRKTAGDVMRRRHLFGGGTVNMITMLEKKWVAQKETTLHEKLEDGTLPFHRIIALDSALNVHSKLYGSIANVSRHTSLLAADLYKQLVSLRHANGRAVCEIYKDPKSEYGDPKTQGPTIAFNIRNAQGGWVGKSDVERLAIVRNIPLRTGGVCDPGGIATFCRLANWELRQNYSETMRCGDDLDVLGGKPTGIVRVSLGATSSQKDVKRFIIFMQDLFVETEQTLTLTQLSNWSSVVGPRSVIESLRVYPIVGCAGWPVPPQVAWPFRETGLVWNEEWCVVLLEDGSPLDPQTHPRMMTIKPYLELERGDVRLVAPNVASSNTDAEYEELTISLWDSPPGAERSCSSSSWRRAHPYQSEASSKFFTSVLGVPSTLARFQDYRNVRRMGPKGSSSPPSRCESSLTVAAVTEEKPRINITLSQSYSNWECQRYIRIGVHYFEVFPESVEKSSTSATNRTKLVYLRNPYDRSPAAQNPTIRVGDKVQSIAGENSNDDLALRACIASINVGEYICPVWNCRKDFVLADHLTAHLQVHKSRPGFRTTRTATKKTTKDTNIVVKLMNSVVVSVFKAIQLLPEAVGRRVGEQALKKVETGRVILFHSTEHKSGIGKRR